jgi:hypothetical protein
MEHLLRLAPHYVVSFCGYPDLLSQWRGYSSTNDGYAVGFRSLNLLTKIQDLGSGYLAKMIYSPDQQDRLVDAVLKAVEDSIVRLKGDARTQVANHAIAALTWFSYQMKHPMFSSEGEWRLIARDFFSSSEVKFRADKGHFVPYVEIPLEDNDIEIIVQGPGVYRAGNREAVLRFANSCGFSPRVTVSAVPLV